MAGEKRGVTNAVPWVPSTRRGGPAWAYVALTLASILWGTGFFFGKIALREVSVGHLVLYRFLFACLVLLPIVLRQRVAVARTDIPAFVVAGILGVPVQFLLQFSGLARTTVSHASVVIGTLPVMLALAASYFARERLHPRDWVALAASSAGVVLIVLGARRDTAGGASMAGDLLVVLSMMAAVVWILISQRLVRVYSAVVTTTYSYGIGTVVLAAWVWGRDGLPPVRLSPPVWAALAIMGVLCTATTTLLWNWALQTVPASRSGIFLNLEPLIGAGLGIMVLRESLRWPVPVGGSLIIAAALYFTQAGARRRPEH
jgi:drug/metabolite transporter (DMT)-like permease